MLTEVGKREKKKKTFSKNLKKFPIFFGFVFPKELKPHKITPPQCTHSHQLSQGSTLKLPKHFIAF